jgi:hypothetical protein
MTVPSLVISIMLRTRRDGRIPQPDAPVTLELDQPAINV